MSVATTLRDVVSDSQEELQYLLFSASFIVYNVHSGRILKSRGWWFAIDLNYFDSLEYKGINANGIEETHYYRVLKFCLIRKVENQLQHFQVQILLD